MELQVTEDPNQSTILSFCTLSMTHIGQRMQWDGDDMYQNYATSNLSL